MSSWACPSPPRAIRYCLPVALCQHSSSSTEILVGGAPSEHQYQIGLCERHWQTIHSMRVGSNTPTATPGLYYWAVKLAYFRGPQMLLVYYCTFVRVRTTYMSHTSRMRPVPRVRAVSFLHSLLLCFKIKLKSSLHAPRYMLQGSNFQSSNL